MADAATQMDAIYRVQRHIYDASRKYYLIGRDGMLRELDPPPGGTVLEIGCGTGRNLVQAAGHHPSARFYGIDVSAAMLDTASASVAKAGLAHCIRLAQADACALNTKPLFGVAAFDRVFFSYVLSMIPDWRQALAGGFAAVAPGGSLHIVDFGEQSRLPGFFRQGLRAWLRQFHVFPHAELESELGALAARTGAELTFARPFRDYASTAVLRKPV